MNADKMELLRRGHTYRAGTAYLYSHNDGRVTTVTLFTKQIKNFLNSQA
jgi:hypothetical protein